MKPTPRPKHWAPSATIQFSRDGLDDVPRERWQDIGDESDQRRTRVWLSRAFLVQEFTEANGIVRLTVCRTKANPGGQWYEGISWDDLQWIKHEVGYGSSCAVEVFPPERDVVNVANMRHLWVLPEVPSFVWRDDPAAAVAK